MKRLLLAIALLSPISVYAEVIGTVPMSTRSERKIETVGRTHATDCTTFTCAANNDGEQCFEQDIDTFYICDGSGTPTWKSIPAGGAGAGGTANGLDYDADTVKEVYTDGTSVYVDPNDAGRDEYTFNTDNLVATTTAYPAVPYPSLKSIVVSDLDGDGTYDNGDFTIALAACSPGCNLILLPVTYTEVAIVLDTSPDLSSGVSFVGQGWGRTILKAHQYTADAGASVASGTFTPVIEVVGTTGPTNIIVQDIEFDGLTREWRTASECTIDNNGDQGAFFANAQGSAPFDTNWIFRRNFSHHFPAWAVNINNGPGGMLIEDNLFEDMGCHTGEIECSPEVMACADVGDGVTGRKVGALTVVMGQWCNDNIVRHNRFRRTAKMAVEVLSTGGTMTTRACGTNRSATDNIIEFNEVGPSIGDGLQSNGSCRTIIRNNYVHDLDTPGNGGVAIGHGIATSGSTDQVSILNNIVENTQSAGIQAFTTQITPDSTSFTHIVGNTVVDACVTTGSSCYAIEVNNAPGSGANEYPAGVIANNTVRFTKGPPNASEVGGLFVRLIENTKIYGNNIQSEDAALLIEDGDNIDVFGNGFIRRPDSAGGYASNTCIRLEDEGTYAAVPNDIYVHSSNTCVAQTGVTVWPTTVADDACSANVCTISAGACAAGNLALCNVLDCTDTAVDTENARCNPATDTATTTTTTLPPELLDAEPIMFPIEDSNIALKTGQLHYGNKTECVMLEAGGGQCLTTNGCAESVVAGTDNEYNIMSFATAADDSATWNFELPKNLAGRTAQVQFVWTSDNAACTKGDDDDVCWAYSSTSMGDDYPWEAAPAWRWGPVAGVTDRCLADGDLMKSSWLTVTPDFQAEERAVVKVFRDVDGGNCIGASSVCTSSVCTGGSLRSCTDNVDCADDDYAQDAQLLGVRLCYEVSNIFSGE